MTYLSNITDEERELIAEKARIGRAASIEANKKKKYTKLSLAVEAKCRECIYDPIGGRGTWLEQVKDCTSYSCPLYEWRPLPKAAA